MTSLSPSTLQKHIHTPRPLPRGCPCPSSSCVSSWAPSAAAYLGCPGLMAMHWHWEKKMKRVWRRPPRPQALLSMVLARLWRPSLLHGGRGPRVASSPAMKWPYRYWNVICMYVMCIQTCQTMYDVMYCMYCVNSYSNMCVSVHVCACACACACVHRHTHTHVHNTQSFEASVGTPVAVCVYKHAHATSVQPNIAHMHSTHVHNKQRTTRRTNAPTTY